METVCVQERQNTITDIICNIIYNMDRHESRRMMEDWTQGTCPTSHFGFHRLVNLKKTQQNSTTF